jgi:hypothetical protein
MKFPMATTTIAFALLLVTTTKTINGFSLSKMMTTMHSSTSAASPTTPTLVVLQMGYLDDLSSELRNTADPNPNLDEEDREFTKMSQDQLDRAGPGSWDSYVEFDEFDGGDGQMGVAGDGNKKLEGFDMSQMAKSKTMSYVSHIMMIIDVRFRDPTRSLLLDNCSNFSSVTASSNFFQSVCLFFYLSFSFRAKVAWGKSTGTFIRYSLWCL